MQLRFLSDHLYVALKSYSRPGFTQYEFEPYQTLSNSDQSHLGLRYVRTATDIVAVPREGGDHECLVQKPMGQLESYASTKCFTELSSRTLEAM